MYALLLLARGAQLAENIKIGEKEIVLTHEETTVPSEKLVEN